MADEPRWSRLAQPRLPTWREADRPRHRTEQTVADDDPDPKAVACYGRLTRTAAPTPDDPTHQQEAIWLRFVAGRPVSSVTIRFLAWCCDQLAERGQEALLLIWDHAAWHVRHAVQTWIRNHNQQGKQDGRGVRLLVCRLPIKSPWLNPIEPKWRHGKRWVLEPDRRLPATELAQRVCTASDCVYEPHLTLPEQAA